MLRGWSALALVLSLLGGSTARATEPQAATDPDPAVRGEASEPHRFPISTQGAIGAAAGAAALIGLVLIAEGTDKFKKMEAGATGSNCRPCSSSDLIGLKAQAYSGFALLGVGGALAITDIVLAVLDRRYRREKLPRPSASASKVLSVGVRF